MVLHDLESVQINPLVCMYPLYVFLIWPFDLIEHDGLVGGWSVSLQGARNYGPYQRNHDELLLINDPATDNLLRDLSNELTT